MTILLNSINHTWSQLVGRIAVAQEKIDPIQRDNSPSAQPTLFDPPKLKAILTETHQDLNTLMLQLHVDTCEFLKVSIELTNQKREEASRIKSELRAQLQATILERVEKNKNQNSWSTLLSVSNVLAAALNLAIGAATGGGYGALLMIAGGVNLLVAAGSEYKLYDKVATYFANNDPKVKENILWHINLWSSIATLTAAITTASLTSTLNISNMLGSAGDALQAAGALSTSLFTIGSGVATYQKMEIEAKIKELQSEDELQTTRINDLIKKLRELEETKTSLITETAALFSAEHEAITKIYNNI